MKDKRYVLAAPAHTSSSVHAVLSSPLDEPLLKQLDPSPAPACLQPCLMFCQANSETLSFQLLIKGGSFITPWMVIN